MHLSRGYRMSELGIDHKGHKKEHKGHKRTKGINEFLSPIVTFVFPLVIFVAPFRLTFIALSNRHRQITRCL
jgi:hypothetical protein